MNLPINRTTPEHIGPTDPKQDTGNAPNPEAQNPQARSAPGGFQGLYLHLPFCFHKCHYCDFYSVVPAKEPARTNGNAENAPDIQDAFTAALCAELRRWVVSLQDQGEPLAPATVFAGGGTPTFLKPSCWKTLLHDLHGHRVLQHVDEFTVEANPETVTPALMDMLVDGGVNRVSIGAQSFDRGSLKALERWHDPDNVPRAVELCRNAGLDNVSLDLIFAIPGQTLDMLNRDLERLLELQPEHLSIYGLTYEPQTALTARLRVGQVQRVDEDTERAMYDHVMTRLDAAGYEQYELSNWARRDPTRDLRCRHNLGYWQNHNWLGLGPAAASHRDGQRWRNAPNLPRYVSGSPNPPRVDEETLPPPLRFGEQLMLGLRTSAGVERAWIDAALEPGDARNAYLEEVIALGLLEKTESHLRLTRQGRFVADTILARLL